MDDVPHNAARQRLKNAMHLPFVWFIAGTGFVGMGYGANLIDATVDHKPNIFLNSPLYAILGTYAFTGAFICFASLMFALGKSKAMNSDAAVAIGRLLQPLILFLVEVAIIAAFFYVRAFLSLSGH